jgi:hypothetical protein
MLQSARLGTVGVGLFGVLTVVAGMYSGAAFAAEVIILRELPPHNVLEQPVPANGTGVVAVPTEQKDLVLSLVPNSKLLNDGEFGSVLASPPPNSAGQGSGTYLFGPMFSEGTRGLSDLPNSGLGSFASGSGLGGIGGQINDAVGQATQGIGAAINSGLGGQ